jgi:hypothetical protein
MINFFSCGAFSYLTTVGGTQITAISGYSVVITALEGSTTSSGIVVYPDGGINAYSI